jgi:hypothetical protein
LWYAPCDESRVPNRAPDRPAIPKETTVRLFKQWPGLAAAACRRGLASAASAVLGGAGGVSGGAAFGALTGCLFALAHSDGRYVLSVAAFCAAAGLAAGVIAGAFYGLHEGRVLGGSLLVRLMRGEVAPEPPGEGDEPDRGKEGIAGRAKEGRADRVHVGLRAPHVTAAPWWMRRT